MVFRKGLPTIIATHELNDIVLNAWNNNRYIAGVFCDLTKAFECVNQELLLKKIAILWCQRLTVRVV
jgi:hypothetical protein